ncbi:type IV secretory system conjugative DNA transfer family protein [Leptolyngbya sp. AN03gr2]|uniref:type IV secretory system conjugative DNA transfer family protein n=1 Tax=unclassified Leptolyngbya TaxID=2650499 RepID=UPI003D31C8E1
MKQNTSIVSVPSSPVLAEITVGKDILDSLKEYNTPTGYAMVAVLLFLLVLSNLLGTGKGKTTTGRLAKRAEKMSAVSEAMQQVKLLKDLQDYNRREDQLKTTAEATGTEMPELPSRPRHNQVTVWCGTPKYWWSGRWRWFGTMLQTMTGSMPTTFIPSAQRSILALGIPNSGKTYSAIDRIAESMMVQGIPMLVYDKKGDQMRQMAPMAARYGYKVHIFAPGEPFSGVINLLDFLRSETDSVMAGEIAAVINQVNSSGGKGDQFFKDSGDQLAKALLQLVKSAEPKAEDLKQNPNLPNFADMATVYAIMQLPGLVKRLDYAKERGAISPWVVSSFAQFISTKDAEKTIAGIMATTTLLFSSFINASLLQSFMGRSTIPKRIEGKQIIIFKLDDERRSVIGPLLAATITMYVVANFATPRRDPLGVLLDELPSLGKIPKLVTWLNELRSNGSIFVMGVQSLEQLYDIYGENNGAAIAAAAATHFLFNTNNNKTAKSYSERFGEKEILVRNKSFSRSMGGPHPSHSHSWNESLQKVPLFTVDELLRLDVGQCILTNPGYKSGGEGGVPFKLRIPIPKRDDTFAKECTRLWDKEVKAALQKKVQTIDELELAQQIQMRMRWADKLLPLPPDEKGSSSGGRSGGGGPVSAPNVLDNFLAEDGATEPAEKRPAPTVRRLHRSASIK